MDPRDGGLELEGTVGLRKLCAILKLEWDPNERSHSVNGIIVEQLGRLPRVGDVVRWRGHDIEVLSATDRRADRLSISTSGSRPR